MLHWKCNRIAEALDSLRDYNFPTMGRLIDSAAMCLMCLAFKVLVGLEPYDIVGFLASAIAVCVIGLLRSGTPRTLALLAFLAICTVLPFAHAFLPVAACLCMFERNPVARSAWIAAWVMAAALSHLQHPVVVLCLCVAAALLAWSTARDLDALRCLLESRDAASTKAFVLSQKNREMALAAEGPAIFDGPAPDPLDGLTQRERQIAMLVSRGKDNHAIADELVLSEGTVRNYISTILSKKQLKNRTQLAVLCLSASER